MRKTQRRLWRAGFVGRVYSSSSFWSQCGCRHGGSHGPVYLRQPPSFLLRRLKKNEFSDHLLELIFPGQGINILFHKHKSTCSFIVCKSSATIWRLHTGHFHWLSFLLSAYWNMFSVRTVGFSRSEGGDQTNCWFNSLQCLGARSRVGDPLCVSENIERTVMSFLKVNWSHVEWWDRHSVKHFLW